MKQVACGASFGDEKVLKKSGFKFGLNENISFWRWWSQEKIA